MSNVFLQGKKERDIGVLLLPRTRNILVPKTESSTPKNYGFFFFSKDYYLALSNGANRFNSWHNSLAFSIFLDMKISGVTLFGGMAD